MKLKFKVRWFKGSLDELVVNETKSEITSSNFRKEGHDKAGRERVSFLRFFQKKQI